MELHGELLIVNSKRPGLEITIPESAEKGDFLTLKLRGDMSKAVAELLECDYLYVGDTPQPGFKEITLDATLVDMELKLIGKDDGVNTYYPESIYGFRVYRKGENELGISCKVDMNGHYEPIIDFFRANRTDGFKFVVRPRQGQLFDGGTRVALSEGTTGDPMNEVVANTLEGIAEATEKAGMLLPTTDEPTAAELVNPTEPPLAPRPRRRKGKVHGDTQPAIEEPAGEAPPWEDTPDEAA
jgi:hypothetical protein